MKGFLVLLALFVLSGSVYAATSYRTMEMVLVPAGSFQMGNSGNGDDAKYNYPAESPRHEVCLSAYYIGKYEVTRGQYRKFINEGGYQNKKFWSEEGWVWKEKLNKTKPNYWDGPQTWTTPDVSPKSFVQTENHPVVGVSYFEAEAFCAWAGGHLPTEAQWERAARGTSSNVYPWGNDWDPEKCNNFWDRNPRGGGSEAFQSTPAGSYPEGASPCGCQDMSGNVGEWCLDYYDEKYYSATPADGWKDPQGPAIGESRVTRGNWWMKSRGMDAKDGIYRCSYRNPAPPDFAWYTQGFRLVRQAEP